MLLIRKGSKVASGVSDRHSRRAGRVTLTLSHIDATSTLTFSCTEPMYVYICASVLLSAAKKNTWGENMRATEGNWKIASITHSTRTAEAERDDFQVGAT